MIRSVEEPRYLQILDRLTSAIRQGIYPVGSNLPIETELCKQYQASRHTIREALRRLVENGLVVRRQKAGTTVVAAQTPLAYVQTVSSVADLFQFALDTDFAIVSQAIRIADDWLAARLDAEPGSTWLEVNGLRTHPCGTVICHTTSFIPDRLSWIGPELPDCRGPFYALLEQRAGETIRDVVQEIRAESMPEDVADSLGCERGSIALRLLRRYVTERGTLIGSFNWHPAESFTYVMRMHRAK